MFKKDIWSILFITAIIFCCNDQIAVSQMSTGFDTKIQTIDKNTITNRITHFVEYRRGKLLETFDAGKSWVLRQPPVNKIYRWVEQRDDKMLETLDRGMTWRIITKEYESQLLFTVSPNVVSESFDISVILSSDKIKSVTIIDILGNTVIKSISDNTQVYIGDRPAGIYYVLVEFESGKYDINKIIKI